MARAQADWINHKALTATGLCRRTGCAYYGKSTKTCDYRSITSRRRPCPVEGCSEYTEGKVRRVQKKYNNRHQHRGKEVKAMECMTEVKNTGAKASGRGPAPDWKASLERKKLLDAAIAEVGKGRGLEDVAAEFGVTAGSIRMSMSARNRKPSAAVKKTGKGKRTPPADGRKAAEPAQAAAPPEPETGIESLKPAAAPGMPPEKRAQYEIENTYLRMLAEACSVKSYDSLGVKLSAIMKMKSLALQLEKILSGG